MGGRRKVRFQSSDDLGKSVEPKAPVLSLPNIHEKLKSPPPELHGHIAPVDPQEVVAALAASAAAFRSQQ
jgi:hypothetical protein